ncbi:phage major capsid protein, partial [Massilia sp. CCM 9206]|nr:phage major capsid protein [Massilia sp. CCM 9206]
MDMTELKSEFSKINDQVKEHGQKALAEAQRGIAMTEGVKQTVDELLVKQADMGAELADVQQKLARRGDEQNQFAKSLGAHFVENDAFKKANQAGDLRRKGGRISVDIEAKAITTTNTGAGVIADRQPGIITQPQRRLTVRDLIAPGRTASNSI